MNKTELDQLLWDLKDAKLLEGDPRILFALQFYIKKVMTYTDHPSPELETLLKGLRVDDVVEEAKSLDILKKLDQSEASALRNQLENARLLDDDPKRLYKLKLDIEKVKTEFGL